MQFYSLNKQAPDVDFWQATINGQAPDKGLYFPRQIPRLDPGIIAHPQHYSNEELAFRVIAPYVGNCIPETHLRQIVEATINFSIPLVPVTDTIASLELYHGPTLAFKDVGARFMSRCLGYFVRHQRQQATSSHQGKRVFVLVATSGDTGGAVANGFYGVDGVEVVILYPSGKVSNVQEKQLTTLGGNIHALEVEGSFDDCQQLVKQAFADKTLTNELFLTSANSINVARWLPQQFYYLLAWKQWAATSEWHRQNPPVFCVPSGNFGNICAGMLAHLSGMPSTHFIAACNANDVVPRFMQNQRYESRKAVATISNAMDVGDPSNFIRILELFDQQFPALNKKFSSVSISDDETRATLLRVFREHNYLTDPHGAVAWLALERYLQLHTGPKGIFLETAHPVKFFDVVEPILEQTIPVPQSVQQILAKPKQSVQLPVAYPELVRFLKNL